MCIYTRPLHAYVKLALLSSSFFSCWRNCRQVIKDLVLWLHNSYKRYLLIETWQIMLLWPIKLQCSIFCSRFSFELLVFCLFFLLMVCIQWSNCLFYKRMEMVNWSVAYGGLYLSLYLSIYLSIYWMLRKQSNKQYVEMKCIIAVSATF